MSTPTIPAELPSPLPSPPRTPIDNSVYVEVKKDIDPWEVCNDYAKRHAKGLCESWREEVDKLLIFAGLFSGVVTAFAIESFHTVQEDPAEMTVLLLRTVIRQLDNMTNPRPNAPVINLDPQLSAPGSANRINTFWFLSLALSLTTVVVGVLCLQWIREYERDASIPHREDVALHEMRFQGLKKWQVFKILGALPVLLISALVLFFAGFIEVLWKVDRIAAILVSALVGLTFFFILATTLLPTLQCIWICIFPNTEFSQCPYKSPQAWMFHKCAALVSYLIHKVKSTRQKGERPSKFSELFRVQGWLGYDRFLRDRREILQRDKKNDVGRGIARIGEMFIQNQKVVDAVGRCLRDLDYKVALEATLRRMDRRRAELVRRADQGFGPTTSRLEKIEYLKDLIVAHALEHLGEKIEQGHMLPALLQQRLSLFLKINEGRAMNKDMVCPINRNNVALISHEKRERTLRCTLKMLRDNLDCGKSHINAMFEIIRSILVENRGQDPVPPLVEEALKELLEWIKRPPKAGLNDPETRLKQGAPLYRLSLVCKGTSDRKAVSDYRQGLNAVIQERFGSQLDAAFETTSSSLYPYLANYLIWRGLA